jgi:recombination protein RecR
MDKIKTLTEMFSRFPGIGPRGAKRFVYFLLTQPKSFHIELASQLKDLSGTTVRCKDCFRYFAADGHFESCSICMDKSREENVLMVVEKDVDLENIERSGVYKGKYFVLGGTVPILDQEPNKKVRSDELVSYIKNNNFEEIVLAMSANPDGDNTGDYVKKVIETSKTKSKISMLGRGLSTGSELEYSDRETIKNAFENRH